MFQRFCFRFVIQLSKDKIYIGGAKRDRTADLLLARQALSQLSYGPVMMENSIKTEQMRTNAYYVRLATLDMDSIERR